jgi:excisionase family DNA binding protein
MKWEEYPEALKVNQAAQLLQIGKNQMYELCHREDFPAVKFGRQFRISKTLLRDWFQKQAKGII